MVLNCVDLIRFGHRFTGTNCLAEVGARSHYLQGPLLKKEDTMDRRQFIVSAGATALTGTLISTTASAAPLQAASASGQKRQDEKERQAVVDACNHCMKSGEACLAMCNEMLRHGMPPIRLLREIMLKDKRGWDEIF